MRRPCHVMMIVYMLTGLRRSASQELVASSWEELELLTRQSMGCLVSSFGSVLSVDERGKTTTNGTKQNGSDRNGI